jgi:hypothetical protein
MRYRRNPNDRNRADRVLDDAFAKVRKSADPAPDDLVQVRNRVMARLADTPEETTIMARFIHTLSTHPRLGFGLAVGVAVILFAALVPLPYSTVIGYTASFSAPSDQAVTPEQYVAAIQAAGVPSASVNVATDGPTAEYTLYGLQSEDEARKAQMAFTVLTGIEPEAAITPVTKKTSGSLFAQAWDKLFVVEVTTDGKTDDQIAAEIAAQIEAQGGTVKEVRIETTEDGQKNISIDIDSD